MDVTISRDRIDLSPGSEIVLRHQTWADYELLLTSRHQAGLKLYFNGATQEIRIVAPLPGQGNRSDTLADLVKALLRFQDRDWHSFDPITLKRSGIAGLEPDACFYIQSRQAILGKEQIDLTVDPPPDLALEVDQTASTQPQDYQALAIPELWIYRRQVLLIFQWNGQQYQESSESLIFPGVAVKLLMPQFVERAWTAGSSVALREFELALQKI